MYSSDGCSKPLEKQDAPYYLSPLQILTRAGIHIGYEIQKADLLLARKVLLAELELSDKTTVLWNGRELGRNEILSMFDFFESGSSIEYHNAIAQDKVLMAFLAQHRFDENQSFIANPLYNSVGFKQFVSPYFLAALQKNIAHTLLHPNLGKAQGLLNLLIYLDESSAQKFWDQLRAILDQKLDQLKAAQSNVFLNGIDINGAGEKKYFHPELIDTLNLLPQHFEGYRSSYGFALLKLASACMRNSRGEAAMYIVDQARFLEGGTLFNAAIDGLLQQIKQSGYRPNRKISDRTLTWAMIALLFFVLIFAYLCILGT